MPQPQGSLIDPPDEKRRASASLPSSHSPARSPSCSPTYVVTKTSFPDELANILRSMAISTSADPRSFGRACHGLNRARSHSAELPDAHNSSRGRRP